MGDGDGLSGTGGGTEESRRPSPRVWSPAPTETGPLERADPYALEGVPLPASWDRDTLWSRLFEHAPIPYALMELATRRVLGNRSCFELFGYEHLPLTWFPTGQLADPDDDTDVDSLIDAALRGEIQSLSFERRFVRSDGTRFTAHVRAALIPDDDGRPWAALLALEDVTDRVEAEQALAESESRLRALVANGTDAVVLIDEQARVLYASPSSDRLIGEDSRPYVGTELFAFAHPEDRAVAVELFAETLATSGLHPPLQLRLCRPDGGVRYVEVVANNLLHDPSVRGVVVNVRDLTDTAEAVSALEMTENRIRRMLENISDNVALLDRDARILLTTGNLRPVMGYPLDYWQGREAFELTHPDDAEAARWAFRELLGHPGGESSGELRMRLASGEYRYMEMNAVNLLDDPDVEAVVVTSRDITARKAVERELAEARDRAEQALRIRTEFIANVSHELRTPIHGILGLSELLATADLSEDARTLARSIGRATDSLRMVLDDILDFAKIEVGRLEISQEVIDITEMSADVGALFEPQARAKGITLTAAIDPEFPAYVVGDGLRIRQVVHNLVGNAVKFTADGHVHVHVGWAPDGEGRRVARVRVRDTGIGIPPEAHAQLFEPFSQAHGDTSREFGGTGLGLSIAKRLVELMGGRLGFTSTPGRGSEFWFTVPVAEATEVPHHAEGGGDAVKATEGLRVLVVEDNPINQLLVRRQLGRLGYDAVVVDNGAAALEVFPAAGADVVLMDWQLPGIDGLETTRRLRAWEQSAGRPRTPVVAITASALPGDRDRCLAAGMDDFIAKPVSIGTLGATVRRWAGSGPKLTSGEVAAVSAATAGSVRGGGPRPGAPGDGSPGPGPGGVDGAVVDRSALDQLYDELADPALVATVVRTFLRELPARVQNIDAACAAGDNKRLQLVTHTLRSTSLAVGAVGLADACVDLENTIATGVGSAGWDTGRLHDMAARVEVELGAALGGGRGWDGGPADRQASMR